MKLSLNWLKNYVPVKLSVDDLVKRLTMAGMEIEHVDRRSDDTVLDIEITPNRPDCLNMWGLAREVAAVTGQKVNYPKARTFQTPTKKCDVVIEDGDACRRYIGILVKGVQVKHADVSIKKHLESVGMRSISNIVDVTNYLLMEVGQPMHAFDYDKLAGGKIIVRRAKAGETITTLDGEERKLDPSILVIADAEKPVAIAGIKGGKSAEVTWETKNILIESAWFDPVLVRRTSRKLKLSSDSSYRFERGVDYAMVEGAALRAFDLIQQAAGGKAEAYRDVQTSKSFGVERHVKVSLPELEHRIGVEIGVAKFKTFLQTLGCSVKTVKPGIFDITVPTFRNDLREQVDFNEEIARLVGYDHIPSTLPSVPLANVPSNPAMLRKAKLRSACLGLGLDEVVAFSTMPEDHLIRTKMDVKETLQILNPLSQEQKVMRPSSLPSFLQIAQTNFNNSQKHLRLFELGKVYGQKKEQNALSFLLTGTPDHDWRVSKKTAYNFYDLKGLITAAFQQMQVDAQSVEWSTQPQAFFDAQHSLHLVVGGRVVGIAGRVADDVLRAWDLKTKDVWFAEINADWLLNHAPARKVFRSMPEFPAIVRDMSFAVRNDVLLKDIQEEIFRNKTDILKTPIAFKDEYRGEGLPGGHRALTLSLTYQSDERTLTDADVEQVHQRIVRGVIERFQATQR